MLLPIIDFSSIAGRTVSIPINQGRLCVLFEIKCETSKSTYRNHLGSVESFTTSSTSCVVSKKKEVINGYRNDR